MFALTLNCEPDRIRSLLLVEYLPISRFRILDLTVGIFPHADRVRPALKISGPRLLRKKFYCGQHAGPCRAGVRRRHPLGSWLEGADFVAFDDMLNDLCDKYQIEAEIWSTRESIGRLYLRDGKLRRNRYYNPCGVAHWMGGRHRSDFIDRFGNPEPAERSDFTAGTPGIPEWLKDRESDPQYAPLFAHERMTRRQRRLAAESH